MEGDVAHNQIQQRVSKYFNKGHSHNNRPHPDRYRWICDKRRKKITNSVAVGLGKSG